MPETAILLQTSIGGIKGAKRAQGRAEGRKGGQEGRQGGQEGRSALLLWPSWNTDKSFIIYLLQIFIENHFKKVEMNQPLKLCIYNGED